METKSELEIINKTKSFEKLRHILNRHLENDDYGSEEVEVCAEKLYGLNKKNINVILVLAEIKCLKGKNEEFISLVLNAYQISKRNPQCLAFMAMLYHDGYYNSDIYKAERFAKQAEKYNKGDILVADICNLIIADTQLQKLNLNDEEKKEVKNRIYSISNKANFRLYKEFLKCQLLLSTGAEKSIVSALSYLEFVSPAIAQSIKVRACILSNGTLGDIKFNISRFYQLLEKDNKPKSMLIKSLLLQCKSTIYLIEGLTYWSEEYGKKNATKAIEYFNRSLELGNKIARIKIGDTYEDLANYKLAYETYKGGYQNTQHIDEKCLYYAAKVCNEHPDIGLKKIDIINLYQKSLRYGCPFASVRLGEIYKKSHDLVYAKKMFQYAVDNINSARDPENDLKIARDGIKEIDELMLVQNNKARNLLTKFSFLNGNEDKIFEATENYLDKIFSKIPTSLNPEIKNYLLLSINTALFYIRIGKNIDFSPCINSLSKAVENILKSAFVEPYCYYLTENKILKKYFSGKKSNENGDNYILLQEKYSDSNHKGQIYFTMGDLKRICKKEITKKNKYDKDFMNFLKTNFIVSNKSATLLLDKTLKQIDSFKEKRDLATHCVPLSINDFEYCLNLVLLDKDALIKNILRKLK